jgi:hypothetical protein
MIQHEKTDNGGSVRVKSPEGFSTVHFTYSNPDSPLSLWCSVSAGSLPHLSSAVVSSLVERYAPSVLLVESDRTEIRYAPKIGSLFRCWTHGKQSVLAEAFSSRDMFNRVCSLSYAMQNTDFVRVEGDEMKLYGYHAVLSKLRENTMPFEFLNLKEECDHSIKFASAKCVERITAAAIAALPTLPKSQYKRFNQALHEISVRQQGERGFDTRYSYIQEVVTAVLLPAVVRFGSDHLFTQTVFAEFSDSASIYVKACEDFLTEHGEIDDSFS